MALRRAWFVEEMAPLFPGNLLVNPLPLNLVMERVDQELGILGDIEDDLLPECSTSFPDTLASFQRMYYSSLRKKRFVTFSSGGSHGLRMLGAAIEMCRCDDRLWFEWLDGLEGLGGNSVGALLAVALACRPPIRFLINAITKFPMKEIMQQELPYDTPMRLVHALQVRRGGVMPGHILMFLGAYILHNMIGDSGISIGELSKRTGKKIRIEAVRWNDCAKVLFSEETTPDVPAMQAVRASASVPIMFEPASIGGVKFIDGGTRNQGAVNVFSAPSDTLSFLIVPQGLVFPHRWDIGTYEPSSASPTLGGAAQKLFASLWAEQVSHQLCLTPRIERGFVYVECEDDVSGLELNRLDGDVMLKLFEDGSKAMRNWSMTCWMLGSFGLIACSTPGILPTTGLCTRVGRR